MAPPVPRAGPEHCGFCSQVLGLVVLRSSSSLALSNVRSSTSGSAILSYSAPCGFLRGAASSACAALLRAVSTRIPAN